MGRGLSPLQRWIVREAGRRADEAGPPRPDDHPADDGGISDESRRRLLYFYEILKGYFGWHESHSYFRQRPVVEWSQHFQPKLVGGLAVYNRGRASLSRACRRLVARGLVRVHLTLGGSGVEITPEGRVWLTVNGARRR